jgi:glycine/D-amino acid oxidase-like deaminating enzyme
MEDDGGKSFWLATYGPYTPNPPLAGDLTVDIAIVGGGFTGLSTAYHLRRADAGGSVAVLEGEIVGSGPAGRNAGFSASNFGFERAVTAARFGRQRAAEAHRYMERAVDSVDALVKEHGIDCDYWFPGTLRVATTPAALKRLGRDLEILTSMGVSGIEWMDAERLRAEVDSPLFLAALFEPRSALLNPAKHVRALKRIAEAAGAMVHERTPVTSVERGARLTLATPGGTVRAGKVVFATNAYSHLIPEIRRRQVPAFTHMIASELLAHVPHFGDL